MTVQSVIQIDISYVAFLIFWSTHCNICYSVTADVQYCKLWTAADLPVIDPGQPVAIQPQYFQLFQCQETFSCVRNLVPELQNIHIITTLLTSLPTNCLDFVVLQVEVTEFLQPMKSTAKDKGCVPGVLKEDKQGSTFLLPIWMP